MMKETNNDVGLGLPNIEEEASMSAIGYKEQSAPREKTFGAKNYAQPFVEFNLDGVRDYNGIFIPYFVRTSLCVPSTQKGKLCEVTKGINRSTSKHLVTEGVLPLPASIRVALAVVYNRAPEYVKNLINLSMISELGVIRANVGVLSCANEDGKLHDTVAFNASSVSQRHAIACATRHFLRVLFAACNAFIVDENSNDESLFLQFNSLKPCSMCDAVTEQVLSLMHKNDSSLFRIRELLGVKEENKVIRIMKKIFCKNK